MDIVTIPNSNGNNLVYVILPEPVERTEEALDGMLVEEVNHVGLFLTPSVSDGDEKEAAHEKKQRDAKSKKKGILLNHCQLC